MPFTLVSSPLSESLEQARKDHVVVVSTLARTLFKGIKEGLNSLQLLENIAGSGQRSQRKRFVVRRRSGKGTWSWITELGKLK